MAMSENFFDAPAAAPMLAQLKAQDFPAALQSFQTLPAELQKSPFLIQEALRCARAVGDQVYEETLERCQALAPAEPSLRFQMMDLHAARGRFDQALAALDAFAASVGEDSKLHVLRAGILLQAGRTAEACAAVHRAVTREASLLEEDPDLAAFVQSENYRTWEQGRAPRPSPAASPANAR